MSNLLNSIRITAVSASAASVMGIDPPRQAGPPASILTNAAAQAFSGQKADRVLLYNPDAIALWLYQKYTALFEKAILASTLQLPMLSVMPSVTPVCFASMYTGAMPEVHGIQAYVKPVLQTDTLFDACLRAGKRPVIISTEGHSISKIFLERDMDYFIYDTYEKCNEKAFELIAQDTYDFITLYNTNYDATMHKMGPEDPASLAMLQSNIDTYAALIDAAQTHWQNHRAMIGFCPDHGCHAIDGGVGSHGLDMEEDMNVIHFYRFLNTKANHAM